MEIVYYIAIIAVAAIIVMVGVQLVSVADRKAWEEKMESQHNKDFKNGKTN